MRKTIRKKSTNNKLNTDQRKTLARSGGSITKCLEISLFDAGSEVTCEL